MISSDNEHSYINISRLAIDIEESILKYRRDGAENIPIDTIKRVSWDMAKIIQNRISFELQLHKVRIAKK